MTTIATDGKSMAGDGRVVSGSDMIVGETFAKVRRLRDGSLLGVAGDASDACALAAWLQGGGERPQLEGVDALRLMPDGQLFYHHNGCDPYPCEIPASLGTGSKLAMGAMLAGASPQKAVEIAASRDVYSGGEIVALTVCADGLPDGAKIIKIPGEPRW